METVRVEGYNRRRRIDRLFFARCHLCEGARIECPAELDPWAWTRRGEVIDFLRDHRTKHGSTSIAGVEIEIIERDD